MKDDNQLIDGLRGIGGAEPPLGFDPDQVADTAAKLHKRRRATIGASIGTLGLVAAVAISVTVANPGEADQVAAATTSQKIVTPKPRPSLVSPKVDLSRQKARNLEHLKQVLKQVKPEATDVTAEMSQTYEDNDLDDLSGTTSYRDAKGGATFNVSIAGPITAASLVTLLEEQCVQLAPPPVPTAMEGTVGKQRVWKGLLGKCEKLTQPDGSVVVLKESLDPKDPKAGEDYDSKNRDDYRVDALHATHYRLDGSVVGVYNSDFLPSQFRPAQGDPKFYDPRPEPALNREQVLKVVTDPEFNLK